MNLIDFRFFYHFPLQLLAFTNKLGFLHFAFLNLHRLRYQRWSDAKIRHRRKSRRLHLGQSRRNVIYISLCSITMALDTNSRRTKQLSKKKLFVQNPKMNYI